MKETLFLPKKPLISLYSKVSLCSLQIKHQKSNLPVDLFSLISLSTFTAKEMGAGGLWPLHQAGNKALIVGTVFSLSLYNVAPTRQRTAPKMQYIITRALFCQPCCGWGGGGGRDGGGGE